MSRLILGFVGLKAAWHEPASPGGRFGIGFPCCCAGEVRAGFFDAPRVAAFGQGVPAPPPRRAPHSRSVKRRASESRSSAVSLASRCSCAPGIVGERILTPADSFAGFYPEPGVVTDAVATP
jgi:hypothetical protein